MTRVLVTGGNGFIGAHLVRHILESSDSEVVSIDRYDPASNHGALVRLAKRYPQRLKALWVDLRVPVAVLDSPRDDLRRRFDYVLHLAASSHVTRSVADPVGFLHDNVLGTAHLLEWARVHQPELSKFLYFSTDEVFGPAHAEAFDEHDRHEPNNPYAASKAAAEQLMSAWANTYGMPLVTTHCTNIFGPGQHPEKFIPLCVEAVRRGAVVQIHARNGVPSSRYYVHVDDVCRAALTVLEKGGVWSGPGTGKYNISGDEELSNLDVAQAIAGHLGLPLHHELCESASNRPRHDQRYALDGTRLRKLGWAPRVRFAEGLPAVVDALIERSAA